MGFMAPLHHTQDIRNTIAAEHHIVFFQVTVKDHHFFVGGGGGGGGGWGVGETNISSQPQASVVNEKNSFVLNQNFTSPSLFVQG